MNFQETDRKWLQLQHQQRERGGLKEAAERSCWRCQSERVARNGGDESFGVGDQDEIVLGGRPNQRKSRCKHARGVGEL
jgi:hypothetical protein